MSTLPRTDADSTPPTRRHLFVIGGGNMGGAIVRGAVKAGVLAPSDVTVIEPDEGKRAALTELGLAGMGGVEVLALHAEPTLLIAVKPQVFPTLAGDLAAVHAVPGCVISVMAGVASATIAEALRSPRVIRTMPNLPAMLGAGCTALAPAPGASAGDADFAASLFASVGTVVRLDESLMDAYTALAGSGPAYLFYLAEAMHTAALQMGFSPEDANAAVRQTLRGAAAMLGDSGQSFDRLRANVTSPGGTTEAAIAALDTERVQAIWGRAILAGRDRAAALARAARA